MIFHRHCAVDSLVSTSTGISKSSTALGNGSSLSVLEGQSLRLVCAVDSNPPARLSWTQGSLTLCPSQPWNPGLLELLRVHVKDEGEFTCQAQNPLGSQHISLSLSLQNEGTALELQPQGNVPYLEAQKGQFLRLLCAADSQPPATLSWVLQDRVLSSSHPWGPRSLGLELPGVKAGDSGRYTCRAENRLGSQQRALDLSVQYPPDNLRVMVSQANRTDPPQLLGPFCSWEAEGLHCSCSSQASPAPSLRWWLGEELLEGNSSQDSFEVTPSSVGPWANSSLSLHGGLSSGLRLSCEAWNVHGAQSGSILQLPDKNGLISTAFSNGAFLGIGITALLFLCLALIIMKILPKRQTQAETPRPRFSRHSTILDYINVVPKAGPLAQNRNQKATSSSPSRTPLPPGAPSPESKKNQKKQHQLPSFPEPKSSTQAPESQESQDELHYATLNFLGIRSRPEAWMPKGTQADYAEVKFQ
ncbi:hypothetical protein H8959_005258 [Pygathrix nigripes]